MQKIERLISMIMILLQKEVVPASEFSRLFQVSKRTIQRDIETLTYANIPIYAHHGHEGGYALMDEYKFDKRLLTHKDIENIVVALDGFEQLIMNEDIELTIQKIKGMSHLELTPDVDLSFYHWVGRNQLSEEVIYLIEAIRTNQSISFDYVDHKGEITHRVVEPYRVKMIEVHWYLVGYCLERKDNRMFKLSRMTDLKKEGLFTPRPQSQMLNEKGNKKEKVVERKTTAVMIELDISVRDQFIERYGRQAIQKIDKRRLLANIELPQNHYAYQFLSGFGKKVKIIEPKEYIEQYVDYLEEALRCYRE